MFSHHAFLYDDLDHYLKIWIKMMMIRYVYIQGYSVVVDTLHKSYITAFCHEGLQNKFPQSLCKIHFETDLPYVRS